MEDKTPPSGDSGVTVNIAGVPAEDAAVVAKALDWQARQNGDSDKRSQRRKERHRAVPLGREVRYFAPTQVEVRAEDDSPEITISGAAIVYGASYRVVDVFGEFRETIHAGAASDLMTRKVDCRLLFNHGGLPMARTASGTMELIDSPDALRFKATLDARQQLANDFAIAVERGDLSQMSVGMIVSRDDWGRDSDGETRDIYGLADLPDLSGVTYPCSETTHIEVARRMAMSMPMESRARLRQMEVELRAGKVLSADSQSKLVTALQSLHDLAQAGGVDPETIGPNEDGEPEGSNHDDDGSEGGTNAELEAGVVYPDGSGARKAPDTAAERREQSLSFGDQKAAVYGALCDALSGGPSGYPDIWICDMGPDWVVWKAYDSSSGYWRAEYSLVDGAVTFAAEPQQVVSVASYQPVEAGTEPPPSGVVLTSAEERESGAEAPPVSMKSSTLRLLNEAGRNGRTD